MSHEEYEYRYCPVCGGGLKTLALKDQEPERLVCSRCEFIFYLDPKVVACSIVEMDNRIILLKRDINPQKGKWVIPGGYVDRGEEVRAAALRETEEECRLKTRIKHLHGVYSYPGRLGVVVVYVAEYLSGQLITGDESRDARLYRPEEIPWDDLAFRSTVDALRDYCRQGGSETPPAELVASGDPLEGG
ncbi:MAG: NUDIX hydrolase [Pseudomonadota bacterium]